MGQDKSVSQGRRKLYTLTEVAKKTGISMPTVQRYKKKYQRRLPAVGKGRRQRYPEEALKVFEQIKKENLAKRGRPKKAQAGGRKGSGRRKKAARKAAAGRQRLLTLTAISKKTRISYPTLIRYVKLHKSRIPHVGRGRRRRFPPQAVDVFRQIRQESPRGRRPRTGTAGKSARRGAPRRLERRLAAVERSQKALARELRALVRALRRPLLK